MKKQTLLKVTIKSVGGSVTLFEGLFDFAPNETDIVQAIRSVPVTGKFGLMLQQQAVRGVEAAKINRHELDQFRTSDRLDLIDSEVKVDDDDKVRHLIRILFERVPLYAA